MHPRHDVARDEVGEHPAGADRRQLVGVADEQHVTVARGAEERVGELEREHRRLVDDDEVVVVGERRVLVPLEAADEGRVRERTMDRHRVVSCEIAHAPRRLPRGRAEQHTLARVPGELDEHSLRVRLAGAREPGQEDERPGAHELDDAPLVVRHLHVGAARLVEERGAASACARTEGLAEPPLHLPELGAIDTAVLDHDLGRGDERADGRLERLGIGDAEEAPRVAPQLVEQEKRVAVRLCVLQDEADPRAEPLRCVELDAERAGDAIGVLEADAADLGEPIRVVSQHADDVVAVLAHEPSREPGPDAVREEKALDLADRRHLSPRGNGTSDALARDRASRLRSHLTEPFRFAVELLEDVLGAEVPDDRAGERRPDAGDAAGEPQLDARSRLRKGRVKRRDDELPAVPCMLRERTRAHELLAGRHVAERPREADRLAVTLLAEDGAPDRELRVVGHVARARGRKRDANLGRRQVARQILTVGRPHPTDHTHPAAPPLAPESAVT